ncbi:hypothetical protein [Kribbella solani]|uniref:Uncharacterized protein n=1 Tax=Kribbella solani TaxID=236067 RepID=A0A841DVJ0_9ACTN|nr:hypothetical protein [Kribbella solani]MBB5982642.1 hypothetical protein [Kribbella solani]MDX2970899.1 hypothetical protein [Kribbella solani]MDX3001061.1 hypothetical protein [Kribbella solani]
MLQTIALTFLGVLMGTNGIPHFVQGITAREYPNVTGNSATHNAIAGLAAFAVAGALIAPAHVGRHPWPALIAGALGAGVMSVFHARRGAYWLSRRFGKPLPEL